MNLLDITLWQTRNANLRFEWFGEDSPEAFEANCKNSYKKILLEKSGWLSKKIVYEFNSLGFRGNEFLEGTDNFCVFGDSVTFGSAMPIDWLYASHIAEELGLHCNNFGVTGGSDSTSFRLALTWVEKLKPKFVIWQKTFEHRLEWIKWEHQAWIYGVHAVGGDRPPITQDEFFSHWIDSPLNQEIMSAKNTMAMRWLCSSLNIPLIETHIEEFFTSEDDRARDLLHPGPRRHREIADTLLNKIPIDL